MTKNKLANETRANFGQGIIKSFDPRLKRAFDVANNEVPQKLLNPQKLGLKENMFKVSGDGVFYTLQGEGPTMGQPAVFLRLHICNLRCVWCDAYYTWNPKSTEFWTEIQDWSIAKTARKIENAWACKDTRKQKRIVITGGEPMLQKAAIDMLVYKLKGWIFEIETNGTIMPTEKMLKVFQFNCSPKLQNSKNVKSVCIKPKVLKVLAKANTTFKFVVMTEKDIDEIERDFLDNNLVPIEKVILMPQGVTPQEVWKNGQRVAEYAKVKGLRLLGRLHADLWGARRRV